MNDDLIVQRLRKSFEEMDDRGRAELWEDLQRRGVIDAEGHVLKRAPEPPEATAANGKRKSKRSRKRKPRRRPAS